MAITHSTCQQEGSLGLEVGGVWVPFLRIPPRAPAQAPAWAPLWPVDFCGQHVSNA